MGIRAEKSTKIESKIHFGPIHHINKNPTLPEPPKHHQTLLLLRRRPSLLHPNVVHVGRLLILLPQKAKDPLFIINLHQTQISLLRAATHARQSDPPPGHQAVEYRHVACNIFCYDRMLRNCAISDGQPFVRIGERLIVGRWIMSVRRLLRVMGMMIVWMFGVLAC